MLPFSYASLSASNEFSVQESNQQLKEGFVALKCNETYAVNELLQGGQEQPSFIDIAYFKQQQLGLFNQLDIPHMFHDPVADWMNSFSAGVSNIAAVEMTHTFYSSKWKFPVCFLLHILHPLWVFSNSCMQDFLFTGKMILCLQWK